MKYTLKVWLTTVFVGSAVLSYVINDGTLENIIKVAILVGTCGLVFSFCTWIVFLIGVYQILKLNFATKGCKLRIQLLACVLALATIIVFAVGFGSISMLADGSFLMISVPYLICLAACIQFYQPPQLYIYHQETETL